MEALRLVEYDRVYFDLSKDWISNAELNRLINAGQIPSDEERLVWFDSLHKRNDYLIWGVEYNGEPIGVSGLKHVADGRAEYWGYIGKKCYWGKGLGRVMMAEVIKKAEELVLSSIWLRVRKYNPRAINLYKKVGFIIEKDEPESYCMSLTLHNNH